MALFSAESELYVAVKTTVERLGAKSMVDDLGIELKIRIFANTSAALGIISRRGIGKTVVHAQKRLGGGKMAATLGNKEDGHHL